MLECKAGVIFFFATPHKKNLQAYIRWVQFATNISRDDFVKVYARQLHSAKTRGSNIDPYAVVRGPMFKHAWNLNGEHMNLSIHENGFLHHFLRFDIFINISLSFILIFSKPKRMEWLCLKSTVKFWYT